MKRITIIITLLLTSLFSISAETITLRTGQQIQGEIILRNDEVVIIRDAAGMKYQYPKTDVLSIQETAISSTQDTETNVEKGVPSKKSAILLNLSGGGTILPPDTTTGGYAGVDLLIGSNNLLHHRIFLGGGVGYRAFFLGGQTYSFLPLQFAAQIPLLDQTHSPILGASLGYGFALSKETKGGLFASFNVGYCYRISQRSMLAISANTQMQQAELPTTEYIIDQEVEYPFRHTAGRCFVQFGINLSLFF